MKLKTEGLSYKLVADLLTSAVAFAIGYFGVDLDPALAAVVAKAIGFLAGVIAPPNPVTLEPAADGELGQVTWQGVLVGAIVAVVVLVAIAVL